MSVLDLSATPGAAPAARRVLRHGLTEARLMVRNTEQLLLALVIPLGILVAGRAIGGRFGDERGLFRMPGSQAWRHSSSNHA